MPRSVDSRERTEDRLDARLARMERQAQTARPTQPAKPNPQPAASAPPKQDTVQISDKAKTAYEQTKPQPRPAVIPPREEYKPVQPKPEAKPAVTPPREEYKQVQPKPEAKPAVTPPREEYKPVQPKPEAKPEVTPPREEYKPVQPKPEAKPAITPPRDQSYALEKQQLRPAVVINRYESKPHQTMQRNVIAFPKQDAIEISALSRKSYENSEHTSLLLKDRPLIYPAWKPTVAIPTANKLDPSNRNQSFLDHSFTGLRNQEHVRSYLQTQTTMNVLAGLEGSGEEKMKLRVADQGGAPGGNKKEVADQGGAPGGKKKAEPKKPDTTIDDKLTQKEEKLHGDEKSKAKPIPKPTPKPIPKPNAWDNALAFGKQVYYGAADSIIATHQGITDITSQLKADPLGTLSNFGNNLVDSTKTLGSNLYNDFTGTVSKAYEGVVASTAEAYQSFVEADFLGKGYQIGNMGAGFIDKGSKLSDILKGMMKEAPKVDVKGRPNWTPAGTSMEDFLKINGYTIGDTIKSNDMTKHVILDKNGKAVGEVHINQPVKNSKTKKITGEVYPDHYHNYKNDKNHIYFDQAELNRQILAAKAEWIEANKSGNAAAKKAAEDKAKALRALGGTIDQKIGLGEAANNTVDQNRNILEAKAEWLEAKKNGDQKAMREAEEKARTAREKGGTIREADRMKDTVDKNKEILDAKKEWHEAKARGDEKGMKEAHDKAEKARREGGTIKEKDTIKDVEAKNKEIREAKEAWKEAKARGDEKAMKEAHEKAEKARREGGTIA